MKLRPFFYFYGGKYRISASYGPPAHPVIVEPFAGSAGYSVRHHDRDVRLYDVDPVICSVWDYLISVSPEEVRRLPLAFDHVDEVDCIQEAKWLMGFWLNQGVPRPRKRPSAWSKDIERNAGTRFRQGWGAAARDRIASQVDSIRHWTVTNASWESVPLCEGTWFVDPPYSTPAGRHYHFHDVDYVRLGKWCRDLPGQVIVCEQETASWLPFAVHRTAKANSGGHGKGRSREVVWYSGAGNGVASTIGGV